MAMVSLLNERSPLTRNEAGNDRLQIDLVGQPGE